MMYTSTRNNKLRVSSAQAIARGISADGGLFLPEEVPSVSLDFIESLANDSYQQRAKKIISLYLTDFTEDELESYVNAAYGGGKFSSDKIAPVVGLHDNVHVLELWHGPTCAFKDMALQLLPHLLTGSSAKIGLDKKIVILVATSGDTGKAALEGFKDVPGTSILVFYPNDGVSVMQQRQMQTQEGGNVGVCAIKGNFDDAQTGVKAIFTDERIAEVFERDGFAFSSANSINWGRLVPQVVYYFSAYADLLAEGKIKAGEKINIVVPTGNFGNILAADYAMRMGLPVKKLICASNRNNILTDFLTTGKYDKNRDFFQTISPSMDILISSNLERLIFSKYGCDSDAINELYGKLKTEGRFAVSDEVFDAISSVYAAGCCDDVQTKATIREIYEKYGYLCDTHTAVALRVCEDHLSELGDDTQTVVASTASPFKFCSAVVEALGGDVPEDEFEALSLLEKMTGLSAPGQIACLKDKDVRFGSVCERDTESMRSVVFKMLGIE